MWRKHVATGVNPWAKRIKKLSHEGGGRNASLGYDSVAASQLNFMFDLTTGFHPKATCFRRIAARKILKTPHCQIFFYRFILESCFGKCCLIGFFDTRSFGGYR